MDNLELKKEVEELKKITAGILNCLGSIVSLTHNYSASYEVAAIIEYYNSVFPPSEKN